MPSYAKFMKDILSRKIRLEDYETIALTEECSAILQNKLPPKLKDPGSFTIPCTIGNQYLGRALCDLGASINLMPFSIFKRLGLGEAKPTTVSLQLADRSIKYPYGVIEDVLVKVEKLILPADFLVLDMEEDKDIPIILGRPFLATGRTLIDVQKGELTMRVQDQEVTFNVFKAMKFPNGADDCFRLDALDTLMFASLDPKEDDMLQPALTNLEAFDDEVEEFYRLLDATPKILAKKTKIDPLPCKSLEFSSSSHKQCKDVSEAIPTFELKPFPSHLRCKSLGSRAFTDGNLDEQLDLVEVQIW
ncbi:uncharacterized protein LOC127796831 [Diospyros lotus]|uniref:uncharacterized protein LOC127796831 n=1 Tax=Diospyros lotus TaxID=55363 RepID=UPI00224DFB01|nr:uncharacterized protein LOC127796831 [Diospyros lotus]